MAEELNNDLNSVIVNAVNARVESAVLAALSGDEVIGRMVSAALNRTIKYRDQDTYKDVTTTYLGDVVRKTIETVAKTSVAAVVAEMQPEIEAEVRKALRKATGDIASSMVDGLKKGLGSQGYGVKVNVDLRRD